MAWEPQLEALSARFHCVAWDLPGYGEAVPLGQMTFPAIATEAVRLLDHLDIARANVVGLSFGGQQALHLVLDHPHRVDKLVLADTSAEFGADGTDIDEWKQQRLAALDAGKTPADLAETIIDGITAPGFSGANRDLAIAAFKRIPSSGLRAAVHCLPTNQARRRLSEIQSQTLVLIGELDTETPLPYAEVLRDEIAGARLEILAGIGHLTPSEGPDLFNQAIESFLLV